MTEEIKDEREHKPSASGLDRELRCLGSRNLINSYKKKDDSNEASRKGDRIHQVLAGEMHLEDLPPSEIRTAKRIMDLEAQMFCEMNLHDFDLRVTEERLWYTHAFDPDQKMFSAKPDAIYIFKKSKVAVVVNYKTGFVPCHNIEENYQVMAESCLTWMGYNVNTVIGVLIHPNYGDYPIETKCFGSKELKSDMEFIVHTLEKAKTSTELTIGTQCDWCPARKGGYCPAVQEVMNEIESISSKLPTISVKELVAQMTPQQRGMWLQKESIVKKVLEDYRDEIKTLLLADKAAVEGYQINEETKRKLEFKTVQEAIALGLDKEIQSEVIAKAGTITAKSLVDAYKEHHKVTQGVAKKAIEDLLREKKLIQFNKQKSMERSS